MSRVGGWVADVCEYVSEIGGAGTVLLVTLGGGRDVPSGSCPPPDFRVQSLPVVFPLHAGTEISIPTAVFAFPSSLSFISVSLFSAVATALVLFTWIATASEHTCCDSYGRGDESSPLHVPTTWHSQ